MGSNESTELQLKQKEFEDVKATKDNQIAELQKNNDSKNAIVAAQMVQNQQKIELYQKDLEETRRRDDVLQKRKAQVKDDQFQAQMTMQMKQMELKVSLQHEKMDKVREMKEDDRKHDKQMRDDEAERRKDEKELKATQKEKDAREHELKLVEKEEERRSREDKREQLDRQEKREANEVKAQREMQFKVMEQKDGQFKMMIIIGAIAVLFFAYYYLTKMEQRALQGRLK